MTILLRQWRLLKLLLTLLQCVLMLEITVQATFACDRIRIQCVSRWRVVSVLLKSGALSAHHVLQVLLLVYTR
jgi:hypothetical protein